MRKKEKNQILEILQTLNEAHVVIRGYISNDDFLNAYALLAECQQTAVGIGEIIEDSEGEDCSSIRLLEDYCETLYQASEDVSKSVSFPKAYKMLDKSLVKVETSVKQDIAIRIEVVFLPYKASMWDSLESVWREANEAPNCDAYVIPIPYFDKNPDGSFREEQYEGDLYPEYVPITRYDEYDFQHRQPDVIFIHNPYDDCNYVTSVHPAFYSKNLKRFTEKLVYIPYFVLGEIDPENEQAIERMRHFCFMPGIINADKVIVQSEKMKQIYVNEYLKAAKENGLRGEHIDREYVEKKISGAGSPKLDRLLRITKEELKIPEDWQRIIRKNDGTDKKIVFYNTSIGALLDHGENMLQKMERVFEIFKENRENVALLWRPHPLLPSTIRAMRPYLWVEYSKIVEKYRRAGWGIYDDSADIDRAVILSDAYYGDVSSVVQLCKKREIPVMILNVEM